MDGCEFVEFDVGVVDVCLVVKAWINDFELCYILISVVISKWLGNIDDDSKGVFLVPVSFGFGNVSLGDFVFLVSEAFFVHF